MRPHEWQDLLVNAVNHKDEAMLASLAAHLAGCEEANRILRAKGYGKSGQAIEDAVKAVPLKCGQS